MKKITTGIFAILFLMAGMASAQTSAGNMMLGGTLSFYSESDQADEDYEYSEFEFSPSFGYFVADNFAVGLNLGLGTAKQDNGVNLTKETRISFGPFARYYKYTSSEQFAFFAQAGFEIGSGKVDVTPGGEGKSSFFNFQVSPGFAYFFNEHWAAELAFTGLVIASEDPNKDNDDDKETAVIFDIRSLSPSLGVRFHF